MTREKGKRLGFIRHHITDNPSYKKKQACFISPGRQDKQVMQNIHEFVINNCIKCFYIYFMAFGSKCIKQSQVHKDS